MTSNLWVEVEDLGSYSNSEYAYEAVKNASYLLWAMSGRKFSGITTVTERYVSAYDPYLRLGASSLTYTPILVEGVVQNISSGFFGAGTSGNYLGDGTSSDSSLKLRGRKVVKVHNLRDFQGNVIDPDDYYLVNNSTILASPSASWNTSNIEVTYTYGTPPPFAGKSAARVLATELVKLYENDDTCALPQRVTSISRQGVSYTVLDNQDFIDELKTGLYAVDLFLKTANPDKARARSKVFSPDVSKARRINPRDKKLTPSTFDLIVTPNGGSTEIDLVPLNGTFIFDDANWALKVILSSYSVTSSEEIPGAAVATPGEDTKNISTRAVTSNVATIVTQSSHGLLVGDSVVIADVNGTFNGTKVVVSTPTSTSFTFALVTGNIATTSSSGTVTNQDGGNVVITMAYSEVLNVIGTRDPGTMTLYAIRPSLGNPNIDEIVEIMESNVSIQLGAIVNPIVNLQ